MSAPIPLSPAQHQGLLTLLQQNFRVDPAEFVPLHILGMPLGRISRKWQKQLHEQASDCFAVYPDHIALTATDGQEAAQMLHETAWSWHQAGLFDGWRNEAFDLYAPDGSVLLALERSAFRPFGLTSHAIHINGMLRQSQTLYFWIGIRSPFKSVDPDKLDNLVGGGIASGETIDRAAVREGAEEAGLPAAFLHGHTAVDCCLSQRSVARGLHREYLHIFDLWLPEDFQPQNQDGEVASFTLMSAHELVEAALVGRFMNDAMLATLNALWRHGYVRPDHPLAQWLHQCQQSAPHRIG